MAPPLAACCFAPAGPLPLINSSFNRGSEAMTTRTHQRPRNWKSAAHRRPWVRVLAALLLIAASGPAWLGCAAAHRVAMPCPAYAAAAEAVDHDMPAHAAGDLAAGYADHQPDPLQNCPYCGVACHTLVVLAAAPAMPMASPRVIQAAGFDVAAKGAIVLPMPRPPNRFV